MHREIRDQWTTALRSREYKQAKNYLRTEEGYCCLGVLCDLAVKAGVIPEPIREGPSWDHDVPHYVYTGDGEYCDSSSGLIDPVRAWAGIGDGYGDEVHTDPSDWESPSLASINDGGASFTEIADKIEEFL